MTLALRDASRRTDILSHLLILIPQSEKVANDGSVHSIAAGE